MEHPLMFDDNDPLLGRVRKVALVLPDAAEKVSHGRPAFYTRKVFAYYGGSVRRGEGDWVQHRTSVVLLPTLEGRALLLGREETYVPGYLGPAGWLGYDLSEGTDWAEVEDLIVDSYRLTAGARRVARLPE